VCTAQSTALARPFTLQLTSAMNGRAVFVLLGLGMIGAHALGYHSAPVSQATVRATSSRAGVAQPAAFSGSAARLLEPAPAPRATSAPPPTGKALSEEKPAASDAKRKVGAALMVPPLQRSSSKPVAINTMPVVGRAPARTIPCEMAVPLRRAGRLLPTRRAFAALLCERCDNGDD
jgi:hypothetical protein